MERAGRRMDTGRSETSGFPAPPGRSAWARPDSDKRNREAIKDG